MTCPACTDADANPLTGSYHAHCLECAARMLANSPAAWRAVNAVTSVDLQRAIASTFGDEGTPEYERGRQRVWHWVKRLSKARAELRQKEKA